MVWTGLEGIKTGEDGKIQQCGHIQLQQIINSGKTISIKGISAICCREKEQNKNMSSTPVYNYFMDFLGVLLQLNVKGHFQL